MLYRKLSRTFTHGYARHTTKFKRVFPELSKLSSEELCDRLIDLDMEFYYSKPTSVNPLIRLTLPFALVCMLLMFLGLPIVFIFTGHWGYSLGEKNPILNWLRSLKLQ